MMILGFVTIIVIEVSYVWQKKISFGPKCHGCVFFCSEATRNKGATSSISNNEDLKMISVHPDFFDVLRDPFCKNEIFKFTPRSIAIEGLYAKSLKDSKCLIEELDKDDKT